MALLTTFDSSSCRAVRFVVSGCPCTASSDARSHVLRNVWLSFKQEGTAGVLARRNATWIFGAPSWPRFAYLRRGQRICMMHIFPSCTR